MYEFVAGHYVKFGHSVHTNEISIIVHAFVIPNRRSYFICVHGKDCLLCHFCFLESVVLVIHTPQFDTYRSIVETFEMINRR